MTVPTQLTFSAAALVAASTSFKNLLDAGGGAGLVRVRDSADVLLAQVSMTDPCGSVNGTTGQLVLGVAGPGTGVADGMAAYAELCDSDGVVHAALPAQAGTVAVAGKVVLNALAIVLGGPVTVLSATVG